jgi:hypothetical protein
MILIFIGLLIWVFMKDYEEAKRIVNRLMPIAKIEAYCESGLFIGFLLFLILK